jgi:hypothetical protein
MNTRGSEDRSTGTHIARSHETRQYKQRMEEKPMEAHSASSREKQMHQQSYAAGPRDVVRKYDRTLFSTPVACEILYHLRLNILQIIVIGENDGIEGPRNFSWE